MNILEKHDLIEKNDESESNKNQRLLELIYNNQLRVMECITSPSQYIRLVKYNDGQYLVDEKTCAVFSLDYMIIGKLIDNKIMLI